MYLVQVGELEPGQIVAKAVTNSGGAILCPPGLELTQAIIERLARAGVDNVAIEGGGSSAERVHQRLDALEFRFRDVTDPLLLELKGAMDRQIRSMLADPGA